MPDPGRPADVELRLPASSAYASVLRTTTAALAARLDFTLDEIEDLRIVVTEAGTLALQHAAPDTSLLCRFHLGADSVDLTISVETDGEARSDPLALDTQSFAWQVLTTLAEADFSAEGGELRISARVASHAADEI